MVVDDEGLRIIDANLNRAREALRVIEDHARFALDDAAAVRRVKHARHALREVIDTLGRDKLLTARDIVGDVGRDMKTASELRRDSTNDIVAAAFGRLSEATRVIAEHTKRTAPAVAAIVEGIRYEAYELEQQIALRGGVRARIRAVRLYVLITERLCRGDWFETAEAALRGGAGCLQLREKEIADRELLSRARRLRELTRKHDALLIINDRPDIARLAAADGVHVGQDDLAVREARRIAGAERLVGMSTHTLAQLESAVAEGPDYIAVGPMFASGTKPQDHIAGPQTLREASARTQIPLVAIGGVTPDNARMLMECGASSVCACAAVVAADAPDSAAQRLLQAVERHEQNPKCG